MPQPRGAERQERRHDEGEGAAHPQGDVQRGPARRTILLDQIPRRLLIKVLIAQTGELDRFLHRIFQVDILQVLSDLLPLLFDCADHRLVRGVEEARWRYRMIEVLVREREGAVCEVPVYRKELT